LNIPALCLSARAGVVRKVGMVDQTSRALGFALAAAALAAVVGGSHVSSAVNRVNLCAVVVTSYVLTFVRVGPASIRGAYELRAGVKAADGVVVCVTRLCISTAFARAVEIVCKDAVRQTVASLIGAVTVPGAAMCRRALVAGSSGVEVAGHVGAGVVVAAGALAVQEGGVDLCDMVRAGVLAQSKTGTASRGGALVTAAREKGVDIPVSAVAPVTFATLT
jgi:hypothetical protein